MGGEDSRACELEDKDKEIGTVTPSSNHGGLMHSMSDSLIKAAGTETV